MVVLGRPGVGKTTLVRKVIEAFPGSFRGFYTGEIRKQGERVGFAISTLSHKEGILAKVGENSSFRVGRYGVFLEDLENLGVQEIKEALREGKALLLDEVGKMELLSPLFQEWFLHAWRSSVPLLVTSCFPPLRELESFWEERGIRKWVLERGNRDQVEQEIVDVLRREFPFRASEPGSSVRFP